MTRRKSVPLGILFDPQRRKIEKGEFDKKYQKKSCEIPTTFGLEGGRGRKKMWEEDQPRSKHNQAEATEAGDYLIAEVNQKKTTEKEKHRKCASSKSARSSFIRHA